MESRGEERAGAGGQEPSPQEGQGGGGDLLGGARVLAFLDWGAVGLPGVKWAGLGFQKDQGTSPWANGHAGGDRPALELSKQGVGLEVWQLAGKGRAVWVPKRRAAATLIGVAETTGTAPVLGWLWTLFYPLSALLPSCLPAKPQRSSSPSS